MVAETVITYKRRRGKKAAGRSIDELSGVSGTSAENDGQITKHFSCEAELVDLHAIQVSLLDCIKEDLPRRPRSKGRVQRMEMMLILEGYCQADPMQDFPSELQQRAPINPPKRACRKRSKRKAAEDLSDSEDYLHRGSFRRQTRGNRNKTMDQNRKLDSEQVYRFLENFWRTFPEEKKNSFSHLDPLWYTLYSENSNKEKVLKWIKKKDIFSKKYVVFPIVQGGHWSLLILCHFGESLESKTRTPCMLLLDSLEKADHSKQLEPEIRRFVFDIYRTLERPENKKLLDKIPFLVPKVPQQRDNEECGLYVLFYIKLFVESAPENFSISEGYPYFMKKDWFDSEGLDCFRKTLDLSRS